MLTGSCGAQQTLTSRSGRSARFSGQTTKQRLNQYFRQAVPSNPHFRQIVASNFAVRQFGDVSNGRFLQSSRQCFASYRGKLMGEVTHTLTTPPPPQQQQPQQQPTICCVTLLINWPRLEASSCR